MCGVMKIVKSMINVWNKDEEEVCVVDRNERRIVMDEDWTNGVRMSGREAKGSCEWLQRSKPLNHCMNLNRNH